MPFHPVVNTGSRQAPGAVIFRGSLLRLHVLAFHPTVVIVLQTTQQTRSRHAPSPITKVLPVSSIKDRSLLNMHRDLLLNWSFYLSEEKRYGPIGR